MITPTPVSGRLARLCLAAAFGALAPLTVAQTVAPTTERATLGRYDRNGNGRLDPEELAAQQADQARAANAIARNSGENSGDRPVELSPFTVSAENDRGYLAATSVSGTRLNSKIEDLASSITVVTKQQLLDTAAVDLNDVFLYEANTEGTMQFTSFDVDRGYFIDNTGTNPQSANRVRGLGAANIARGNFASTGTIPIDTYNVDSVEISRGPNSNIFGLGEAAGTVNINTARARLRGNTRSFSARVDSFGGWRSSFDINQPLISDKLAIRINGLYEEKGFTREPARDKTNRGTFNVTAKPFAKTTIRASYESYHNYNSRPNSVTPRDYVSYWNAAGRPTWDPITSSARVNGQLIPVTVAQEQAGALPPGLVTQFTSFWNRPSIFIDQGRIQLYTVNRSANPPAAGAVPSPGQANSEIRYAQIGQNLPPLYLQPGISDRGLYDWANINFAAPNWAKQKADIYQLELEQWLIDTQRHKLALQAGYFREDIDKMERNFIGSTDGAGAALMIDVNERLLDGSPNPFFLRPYIGGSEPQIFRRPEENNNYRGTLAYQLDLSREKHVLAFLGRHNFAGYAERRDIINSPNGLRYRDKIVSDHPWIGTPGAAGFNRTTAAQGSVYPRYYLGDNQGFDIDYAPARLEPSSGTFPLRWFNAATGQWVNENVTHDEVYFSQGLQKREIRTQGLVWQGYFWGERIVPTVGYRKDKSRTVNGGPAVLDINRGLFNIDQLDDFGTNWLTREGSTRTKGIVVKPLRWLHLHYNESDSFKPEVVAQNVLGEYLPNPTGKGKDYGISFNLFDNKLYVRLNKYETFEKDARTRFGTTISRVNRLDFDLSGAGIGGDPFDLEDNLETWLTPSIEDPAARRTEVLRRLGFTEEFLNQIKTGGTVTDINDAESKGYELELNYNPTRHWTFKATAARQQAIDSALSPTLLTYVNQRMPIWKAMKAPGADGVLGNADDLYWWTNNTNPEVAASNNANIPLNWFQNNVWSQYKLNVANVGKSKPQVREWRFNATTNYQLAGLTEHRILRNFSVGGSVRWEDQAAIGYLAGAPDPDGVIRELDANKPVFDKARFYGDLLVGYNLRLWKDKVRTRLQLNVRNVLENGRLQPVSVNPNGEPNNFRIIEPRQFIFTATFDL
jgi:outer membrane receptor protein involved in Fe transport